METGVGALLLEELEALEEEDDDEDDDEDEEDLTVEDDVVLAPGRHSKIRGKCNVLGENNHGGSVDYHIRL